MLSKTTFVVAGAIGDQAKVVVIGVEDVVAADALRTALQAMSDGAFQKMSFSSRTGYVQAYESGSNTDYRGVAYFQNTASGSIVRLTIPALKSTYVEAVPGRDGGERITSVGMAAIETALETATGLTFTALYGVVVQKR